MKPTLRWLGLAMVTTLLLGLGAPTPARAADGPATMLKDINPHGTADPSHFTAVGNTLFFTADDGVHGRELWKSDGTAVSTVLVKDINLGATGAFTYTDGITNVNGTLFFAAADGVPGRELWKSDGTAAGTMLVKDIASGADSGLQANDFDTSFQIANLQGTLLFGASGALWRSDGSAAGTVRVAARPVDWLTVVNGV